MSSILLEDDLYKIGIKEGDLLEIILTKTAKYKGIFTLGWKGELLRPIPNYSGNKIAGYFKGFKNAFGSSKSLCGL